MSARVSLLDFEDLASLVPTHAACPILVASSSSPVPLASRCSRLKSQWDQQSTVAPRPTHSHSPTTHDAGVRNLNTRATVDRPDQPETARTRQPRSIDEFSEYSVPALSPPE